MSSAITNEEAEQYLSALTRPAILQNIQQTDCVTFQPCTNLASRNQDRFVVSQLDVGFGGRWELTAVFDGKNQLNHSLLSAIEP
jgi:pyruvate dehydrogenase phosphatase